MKTHPSAKLVSPSSLGLYQASANPFNPSRSLCVAERNIIIPKPVSPTGYRQMGHKRCSSSFRGVGRVLCGNCFRSRRSPRHPFRKSPPIHRRPQGYFNPKLTSHSRTQAAKDPKDRFAQMSGHFGMSKPAPFKSPWATKKARFSLPLQYPPCAHQEPSLLYVLDKSTVRQPHKTNPIYRGVFHLFAHPP